MNKILPVIACSALFTAVAHAQSEPTPPPGTPPQHDLTHPSVRSEHAVDPRLSCEIDSTLCEWLMIENQNQIALGDLAQSRAQSDEVKQFARKMVEDHAAFSKRLAPFSLHAEHAHDGHAHDVKIHGHSRDDATDPVATQRAPGSEKPTAAEQNPRKSSTDDGPDAQSHPAPVVDHCALVRELGRKRLESSMAMLNEKKGAAFDECYMDMQVFAHQCAKDTLDVFHGHASASLKATIAQGIESVKAHQHEAADLARKIDEGRDRERRS